MKVKVGLSELQNAVAFVSANVSERPHIPLLKAVKLEAKSDTLVLVASDSIAYVQRALSAKVKELGEVFVEGALLNKSVSSLMGDGDVDLSTKKKLSLSCGSQKRSLVLMEGEYPEPPKPEFVVGWNQVVTSFLHKASLVQFAVAQDHSRPELMGVNFGLKNQTVVGGDGKRMAFFDNPLDTDSDLSPIFDPRFFQEVTRSGMSGNISISISESWIRALSEDHQTAVWVKAMNRAYPVEAVQLAKKMQGEPGVTITLDRKVFLNSLSLAVFYADKAKRSNEDGVLVINADGEGVWAEMTVPNIAEMKDPIPGGSDKPVSLRVQPDLLYQAVSAADAEQISIKVVGNKLFIVTDPNNPGWGYVQTPMVERDSTKVEELPKPEVDEEIDEPGDF